MKYVIALLCALFACLSLHSSLAEGSVVNLIAAPEAVYAFNEDATILEIVFPRVYSSDCAILRFGDETMMIDGSLAAEKMQERVRHARSAMGGDHIDVAFNSHPHRDHICGFPEVHKVAPIAKLLLTFPEDFNDEIADVSAAMREGGVTVEHVGDGDRLTLGANGEVTMDVMQRNERSDWTLNDRSAMLLITYGERTILFTGDVENRAQKSYALDPPPCGLKADILKYPHHGLTPPVKGFFAEVSPELAFLNGAANVMDQSKRYLKKREIPFLFSYKGLTRMRTDGSIWVVDYLEEPASASL